MGSLAKGSIPVPTKVEEITPEWISKILKMKISSENFNLQTDIQQGSGFLSKMSRLNCKSEDGNKSLALVVKLLPEVDVMRSLVLTDNFDKSEIQFYKVVMPELLEAVPELEAYLCSPRYGHVQPANEKLGLSYSSVLVLEDLKPLGYHTINFGSQANPAQIQEVVEFLAKFHFAAMAVEDKKGQKLNTIYDFLQGGDQNGNSKFYEMVKNGYGYTAIEKVMKEHGTPEDIIHSLMRLEPHTDTIISKVEEAGQALPCLIHGDLWPNNIMFNYNPGMNPKIIDWQFLGYKDPALDLACIIFSIVSIEDLRSKDGRILELLHIYWDTFISQCKKTGKEHLIKREFETFKTFFYTWGASYMVLWLLLSAYVFSANYPKLVKIYELLLGEIDVPGFLGNIKIK